MGPLIRFAAVLCCAIVALSFALFVIDESRASSEKQVESVASDRVTADDVNAPDPSAGGEAVRERLHGSTREAIDDANDVLARPFAAVVSTDSAWANRLITLVLALLVYGLLGGILANAFSGGPRETRDWREVAN